jgi:hypothetical protein
MYVPASVAYGLLRRDSDNGGVDHTVHTGRHDPSYRSREVHVPIDEVVRASASYQLFVRCSCAGDYRQTGVLRQLDGVPTNASGGSGHEHRLSL